MTEPNASTPRPMSARQSRAAQNLAYWDDMAAAARKTAVGEQEAAALRRQREATQRATAAKALAAHLANLQVLAAELQEIAAAAPDAVNLEELVYRVGGMESSLSRLTEGAAEAAGLEAA